MNSLDFFFTKLLEVITAANFGFMIEPTQDIRDASYRVKRFYFVNSFF